jgi:hypothetical protein
MALEVNPWMAAFSWRMQSIAAQDAGTGAKVGAPHRYLLLLAPTLPSPAKRLDLPGNEARLGVCSGEINLTPRQ